MPAKLTEIDITNLGEKTNEQIEKDILNIKRLIGQAARNEDWKIVELSINLLEVILNEKVDRELKREK